MGARGPIPSPSSARRLRGERRPSRLKRAAEPIGGATEAPAMPRGLSKPAQRVWRKVVPDLAARGLINELDTVILQSYCAAVAELEAAERVLATEGAAYTSPRGAIRQRPEVIIVLMLRKQVIELGNQLGMSPAARMRMRVPHQRPEPAPVDPFERFLAGGRSVAPGDADPRRVLQPDP